MTVCPICNHYEVSPHRLLCAPCARSYDYQQAQDVTMWAMAIWAAARSRKYERRAWAKHITGKRP